MEQPKWPSTHWISLRDWRPSCHNRGSISLVTTVCWRPITAGVGALHRPNAAKARSEWPILTFAHPLNGTSRYPEPSDSSAYSISMSRFAVIAVGPSKSSPALRTRTLSTGFWLIFARKNKAVLPYRTWCHPREHPLGHYLFSQDANPQPQMSKDATEKRVVRTVACYRS
jgi:hypothetical protein